MVHDEVSGALTYLLSNELVDGMIVFFVLSTAVRALPEPEENGSKFYLWFYNFTHGILANYELLRKRGPRNG